MRKHFGIMILLILISVTMFGQVTTICNHEDASLRVKPGSASDVKIKIPKNAEILVISQIDDNYFKVVYKTDTGYLINLFIGDNTTPQLRKEIANKLSKLPGGKSVVPEITDDIDWARKLYGPENKKTKFVSGEYDSITLTWYCVNGKYRSVTYLKYNGKYIKDSEYVSDCINN